MPDGLSGERAFARGWRRRTAPTAIWIVRRVKFRLMLDASVVGHCFVGPVKFHLMLDASYPVDACRAIRRLGSCAPVQIAPWLPS